MLHHIIVSQNETFTYKINYLCTKLKDKAL